MDPVAILAIGVLAYVLLKDRLPGSPTGGQWIRVIPPCPRCGYTLYVEGETCPNCGYPGPDTRDTITIPVDSTPLWNPETFSTPEEYREYVWSLGDTEETRAALRELIGLTDSEIDEFFAGPPVQKTVCPHCGAVDTIEWRRWARYDGLEATRYEYETRWSIDWNTGQSESSAGDEVIREETTYWKMYCSNCKSYVSQDLSFSVQPQTYKVKRWVDNRGNITSYQTFTAWPIGGSKWKVL